LGEQRAEEMLGSEKEHVRGDRRRMAWSTAPRFFLLTKRPYWVKGVQEAGDFWMSKELPLHSE